MSEFQPVATLSDLEKLDADEMLDGYRAGLAEEPQPGSDKSKSFWHGWRNGMMDRGKLPHDRASTQLCQEYVAQSNRKGMH